MAPPKMRTKALVFYVEVANHPMRTKLLFLYLSKWQPPMRTKLLVSKSKWRPPMRTKLVKKQDLCEEHSPYILYTLLVYGSSMPIIHPGPLQAHPREDDTWWWWYRYTTTSLWFSVDIISIDCINTKCWTYC